MFPMKKERVILRLSKIFIFLLFLSLLSLPLPSLDFLEWLRGQNPSGWEYEKITSSVYYKKIFISDIPLSIHILKVNRDEKFINIDLHKAEDGIFGRKTLREIVENEIKKGKRVIAGINASFFEEDGKPVGLFVDEGCIYTLSNIRSSLIKTVKGGLFISKTNVEVLLEVGRERFRIKRLNIESENSESISLFNHAYNRKIKIGKGFAGIIVEIGSKRFSPTEKVKGYVEEIVKNGEIQPGKNKLLIVGRESDEIFKKIKIGKRITFVIRNSYFKDDIEFAVTGAPQIVRKGLNVYRGITEGLSSRFVDSRHPRTGIGITKDRRRLFLIAVDGRQPGLSIGMTLKELAELFIKLGCYDSLNLDGGGSTTMWLMGKVVNSPSDPTGERPISDAILIIEKGRENLLHQ